MISRMISEVPDCTRGFPLVGVGRDLGDNEAAYHFPERTTRTCKDKP